MARKRQRKQNRALDEMRPAAEPVFDDPALDEPVFDAEPPPAHMPVEPFFAEPSFDDADPDEDERLHEAAPYDYRTEDEGEPHFDASPAMPAQPHLAATAPPRLRNRRLGRTAPFWVLALGVFMLIITLAWLGLRDETPDSASRELATPLPGLAGSTTLPLEVEIVAATPAPLPTDTPLPLLTVNQRVRVGNTDGQGIRLRNQPSLTGQTLAIYKEGDPFVVLEPDGSDVAYPVEADDYRWYRIQVVDTPGENLTGWAVGDFLVPATE